MSRNVNKEDLSKGRNLTWGELKKFAERFNIPDDAPVLIQRIEDVYYDKHNWGTYKVKGEFYAYLQRYNKRVKEALENPEQYPNWENPTPQNLDDPKNLSEYTPASSPIYLSEDPDILFIDLHY